MKSDSNKTSNAGKIILSVGYGYPDLVNGLNVLLPKALPQGNSMNIKTSGYGPFHFRLEYGLTDRIGIGISVNYAILTVTMTGYNSVYPSNGTIYYTDISTIHALSGLIRINYHFATTRKLDPYFAFGAGFRTSSHTYTTNPNGSANYIDYYTHYDATLMVPIALEAVMGLHYYFSKNVAIYSELGIAKSIIQAGVTIKL